jgi:hypothetical protein
VANAADATANVAMQTQHGRKTRRKQTYHEDEEMVVEIRTERLVRAAMTVVEEHFEAVAHVLQRVIADFHAQDHRGEKELQVHTSYHCRPSNLLTDT